MVWIKKSSPPTVSVQADLTTSASAARVPVAKKGTGTEEPSTSSVSSRQASHSRPSPASGALSTTSKAGNRVWTKNSTGLAVGASTGSQRGVPSEASTPSFTLSSQHAGLLQAGNRTWTNTGNRVNPGASSRSGGRELHGSSATLSSGTEAAQRTSNLVWRKTSSNAPGAKQSGPSSSPGTTAAQSTSRPQQASSPSVHPSNEGPPAATANSLPVGARPIRKTRSVQSNDAARTSVATPGQRPSTVLSPSVASFPVTAKNPHTARALSRPPPTSTGPSSSASKNGNLVWTKSAEAGREGARQVTSPPFSNRSASAPPSDPTGTRRPPKNHGSGTSSGPTAGSLSAPAERGAMKPGTAALAASRRGIAAQQDSPSGTKPAVDGGTIARYSRSSARAVQRGGRAGPMSRAPTVSANQKPARASASIPAGGTAVARYSGSLKRRVSRAPAGGAKPIAKYSHSKRLRRTSTKAPGLSATASQASTPGSGNPQAKVARYSGAWAGHAGGGRRGTARTGGLAALANKSIWRAIPRGRGSGGAGYPIKFVRGAVPVWRGRRAWEHAGGWGGHGVPFGFAPSMALHRRLPPVGSAGYSRAYPFSRPGSLRWERAATGAKAARAAKLKTHRSKNRTLIRVKRLIMPQPPGQGEARVTSSARHLTQASAGESQRFVRSGKHGMTIRRIRSFELVSRRASASAAMTTTPTVTTTAAAARGGGATAGAGEPQPGTAGTPLAASQATLRREALLKKIRERSRASRKAAEVVAGAKVTRARVVSRNLTLYRGKHGGEAAVAAAGDGVASGGGKGAKAKGSKKVKKVKTEPCLFFCKFGKCSKSDAECRFVHDKSKVAVCRAFLKGKCTKGDCPLTHAIQAEKMPVCIYFEKGMCFTPDCPYLHVKVSENAPLCPSFLKVRICMCWRWRSSALSVSSEGTLWRSTSARPHQSRPLGHFRHNSILRSAYASRNQGSSGAK